MTKTKLISFLVSFSILLSCTSPSQNLVTPTFEQPTQTSFPTTTPKPVTPTATPFPPLQTNGPYLFYIKNVGTEHGIAIMDVNGKGRKYFSPPEDVMKQIYLDSYFDSISIYGKVAFYTGSAGLVGNNENNIYDLALNMFDLQTGETEVITPLLSEDYPNNFTKPEQQLTANVSQGTFILGITKALSWSPDGKNLAFAGQMDGLSSDLYIYDLKTKNILRLSEEEQQLQWISWSPDGQKVLFGTTYALGMETIYDIYVTNLDGSLPTLLSSSKNSSYIRWLNSQTYFETDSENVLGQYNLRLVNIDTGKTTSIWKGSYHSYTVDKEGEWIMLNASSPDIDPQLYFSGTPTNASNPSLFLINLATLEKIKVDIPQEVNSKSYFLAYSLGLGNQKFILTNHINSTFTISDSLSISTFNMNFMKISPSPNKDVWVGVTENGINIYSLGNQLVREIPISFSELPFSEIIWSPIPNILFLTNYQNIYLVNILTGEVELVEENLTLGRIRMYQWMQVSQ